MLKVEDQLRRYADCVLERVEAVGVEDVIGPRPEEPARNHRSGRRRLLALSAVAAGIALVLAGLAVFDETDEAVIKTTRPTTTVGDPASSREPAASLETGRFATPELPEGFWRVRAGDFATGPMRTYSERFSPWDGDLRTYSSTPRITVATMLGDTSRYMENVRAMTEPVPSDLREVVVRGRPALLKVLHHELGDLIILLWVDVPGLAVNVSGGGVTVDDVMRAAESVRPL